MTAGTAAAWHEVGPDPPTIDCHVATAARIHDHLLGGTANFAVDRRAVEWSAAAIGGVDHARADARANRRFLQRAVHRLAAGAGIRQFLDIGTGVPRPGGVGDVARRVAATTRTVHVDHDPIVLAHAHQIERAAGPGGSAYVDADLRDPERVLGLAGRVLDLDRPVAVVLTDVLHLLADGDDPAGVVAHLAGRLPPGSYVVVSHPTGDFAPEAMAEMAVRMSASLGCDVVPRSHDAVARLLGGLALVAPGLVQADHWPAAEPGVTHRGWRPALYGAVARVVD